jgi:hypothetical protein
VTPREHVFSFSYEHAGRVEAGVVSLPKGHRRLQLFASTRGKTLSKRHGSTVGVVRVNSTTEWPKPRAAVGGAIGRDEIAINANSMAFATAATEIAMALFLVPHPPSVALPASCHALPRTWRGKGARGSRAERDSIS